MDDPTSPGGTRDRGDRGTGALSLTLGENSDQAGGALARQVARDAPALGLALLGLATDSAGSIALLGPDPATFWDHLTAAPEWGGPDPVDRWSQRVIGDWATRLGVEARYPFGTPAQPFLRWALASGRCQASPVGMLVHETQGLLVGFRGALILPEAAPPAPTVDLCAGCAAPCLTTCPVGALGADGYDVEACRSWVAGDGAPCRAQGCAARRACPRSPRRPHAQAGHHMVAFLCE